MASPGRAALTRPRAASSCCRRLFELFHQVFPLNHPVKLSSVQLHLQLQGNINIKVASLQNIYKTDFKRVLFSLTHYFKIRTSLFDFGFRSELET